MSVSVMTLTGGGLAFRLSRSFEATSPIPCADAMVDESSSAAAVSAAACDNPHRDLLITRAIIGPARARVGAPDRISAFGPAAVWLGARCRAGRPRRGSCQEARAIVGPWQCRDHGDRHRHRPRRGRTGRARAGPLWRTLRRQADGQGGGRPAADRRPARAGAVALAVAAKEAASKALGTGWSQGVRLARRRSRPRRRAWRCSLAWRHEPPRWRRRGAPAAARGSGWSAAGRSSSARCGCSREPPPRRRAAQPGRDRGDGLRRVHRLRLRAAVPAAVRGELGVHEPEAAALWAGVLIGISPLLAGLLAPVWGRLADRHGHKAWPPRRWSPTSSSWCSRQACTNVPQLLALRVGHRALRRHRPAGLAMATSQSRREDTGRAVGSCRRRRSSPRRSARWREACSPTRSASGARSW